jgi:hypothetical protein
MKRVSEENEYLDLCAVIGKNAIECLNEMPLYCDQWLALLQTLTKGVDPAEVASYLSHGTTGNLRKSIEKLVSLNENGVALPLFEEKIHTRACDPEFVLREEEAQGFLVDSTREDDKNHRLYTTESISNLYAEYVGTVANPVGVDSFTNVYRSLRILRERHCKHDIYTCPYCDDYLPMARHLLSILDPNHADYEKCQELYSRLCSHKERFKIQTGCFYEQWNNPPVDSLVIAEDAGKRFVLDGKGVCHVIMLRYMENGELHERHYFFCLTDSTLSVNRFTIACGY